MRLQKWIKKICTVKIIRKHRAITAKPFLENLPLIYLIAPVSLFVHLLGKNKICFLAFHQIQASFRILTLCLLRKRPRMFSHRFCAVQHFPCIHKKGIVCRICPKTDVVCHNPIGFPFLYLLCLRIFRGKLCKIINSVILNLHIRHISHNQHQKSRKNP